ncbi:MAG: right-handed parallel beta-helix repeat-containing protein [Candidatus Micrarchaeia archaeon]
MDENGELTNNNKQEAQSNQQLPPIENFIPGQQPKQPQTQSSQQPQAQQTQQQVPEQNKKGGKEKKMILYIGVVLIILIAAVVLISSPKPSVPVKNVTAIKTNTTIKQQVMEEITSCTNITQPGRYYLSKNINISLLKGSCINIRSNNVELIGNSNKLKGSGPYSGVPPFTYGIMAKNVNNITINSFGVTQFSFGIYFENVNNSIINNCNITKNTMANIFLKNTSSINVENTLASVSTSSYGGINIQGGGNNTFSNDTLYGNAYYGFFVNSTGNKFISDTLSNNLQDFACYENAGFSKSNIFRNVICAKNSNCNFAWCSQSNEPLNMSTINLQGNITSCGTINKPGAYTIISNISATQYMNMSNKISKTTPCININQPNVELNCNGHTISNSGYAISITGNYNQSVENCVIKNSTFGIYLNSVLYPKINNIKFINNTYGIFVNNMNSGEALNITGSKNIYGAFINRTSSFTFSNFNFTNNNYGIYANTGGSNIYYNGNLNGNKNGDLYCTASSYNVSPSMFISVSCGVTDCNWGISCSRHALPPISLYPLSNCTTITNPGNYSITGNIKAVPNCFTIKASNVSLNCNGALISGTGTGSAFTILNESNVSINNCNVKKFWSGIVANNTPYIKLKNMSISNVGVGVILKNTKYGDIFNIKLSTFDNIGYLIDHVFNSIISNNYAYDGVNSSGFIIDNSTNNLIKYNNATSNAKYGFFIENSNNNNIFNNSAYSNKLDYACSKNSSNIYDELNGVNFGNTKGNCIWLVELNSQSLGMTPLSFSTPATVVLSQDILYNYGDIMFNIYNTKNSSANSTLINCNHHTIFALNGGTFVNIENSSNVKVENCYLKNFTYAVKTGGGSYMQVINNTIVNTNIAISQSNGAYPRLFNNTILNSSYGILLINTNYGIIKNNNIADTNVSIQLTGGNGYQIISNKANYGNIGLYLLNSTIDILQGNSFLNMGKYGAICTGFATNSSSLNKDNGNNTCTSNHMCYWITNSPLCEVQ